MRYCTAILFILMATIAVAQTGTVSGRVLDAETLEPLPMANVFIANTTLGASTSNEGDFTINKIPIGTMDIVFTYLGYQSYQAKVVIKDGEALNLNVKLISLKEQLTEVAIKAKRDKTWERQLHRFETVFFGTDDLARQCKIDNAYVIDFNESADGKFTASATSPIVIENRALGYKLNFVLKNFVLDNASYSIVGNVQFIELEASSSDEALQWNTNRYDAYTGSLRHFFRSLIAGNSVEQGFRFYSDKTSGNRIGVFDKDLGRSIVPYELTGIVQEGNSVHDKKLLLKDRVEVHFIHDPSANYIYKNIDHAISSLEIRNGSVSVSNNGVLLNPLDVVVSGDMASARVANMLPLDYRSTDVVKVRTKDQARAEKLFESVYVHTNKAFYYPGEVLWFKAYMNYKDPRMADTLSTILYIDMVNSSREVIQSKVLKISGASAPGSFRLPEKMAKGTYALNVYTNWMKNYGTSSFGLKVFPVLDLYERVVPAQQNEMVSSPGGEVIIDKEKYTTRDLVKVSVDVKDENGKPVLADLSVSVTDMKQVPFVSWPNPDIVTSFSSMKRIWLPSGKLSNRIERGITFSGVFTPAKGKQKKTDLTIMRGILEDVRKVTTDDAGNFSVYDLDIADSALFNYTGRRSVNIEGTITPRQRQIPFNEFKADSYVIPVTQEVNVQRVFTPFEIPADAVVLQGVEVKSTKMEKPKEGNQRNAYGDADVVLKGDEMAQYGSIEGLLRSKAPGFVLNFDGIHYLFSSIRSAAFLASAREPVLTIDNRQIIPSSGETVGDYLMQLQVDAIDRIEISTVARSYVGANGGYGLVAVYMKRGGAPLKNSFATIVIKGYETPTDFSAPDYNNADEDHSFADRRPTLYWNRKVMTNTNGRAEFQFFTSDLPGRYRIVIEGITGAGKPLHFEKLVDVIEKK